MISRRHVLATGMAALAVPATPLSQMAHAQDGTVNLRCTGPCS